MAEPVQFTLSKPKASALVKELAVESSNVVFTVHALRRMKLRKVTPLEIFQCLLKGVIVEGPVLGVKGDWELAIERMWAGRKLRVALAIDMPKRLIVITVYDSEK
jgi:hypothetical protein